MVDPLKLQTHEALKRGKSTPAGPGLKCSWHKDVVRLSLRIQDLSAAEARPDAKHFRPCGPSILLTPSVGMGQSGGDVMSDDSGK